MIPKRGRVLWCKVKREQRLERGGIGRKVAKGVTGQGSLREGQGIRVGAEVWEWVGSEGIVRAGSRGIELRVSFDF